MLHTERKSLVISVDKRLQLRELKVRAEIVVTEAENVDVRGGFVVTWTQKAATRDTLDKSRVQVDGGSMESLVDIEGVSRGGAFKQPRTRGVRFSTVQVKLGVPLHRCKDVADPGTSLVLYSI